MLPIEDGGASVLSKRTVVGLAVFLVFGIAFVVADYACGGCYHMPVPGLRASARQSR